MAGPGGGGSSDAVGLSVVAGQSALENVGAGATGCPYAFLAWALYVRLGLRVSLYSPTYLR